MISELFRIGPLSISPFGVMLVVAFLCAYQQLRWGMRELGVGDEEDASALLLAAAVGGLLGGKVYYAILQGDWHTLIERAGIVFYGSLIGGAAAVLLVVRWRRLPVWKLVDACAPSVAIGYAIGRIGCLLVGDDYGIPTTLPWGMTFPEGPVPTTAQDLERFFGVDVPPGYAPGDQVPVHPTQLYETVLALGIWWLGRRLVRRGLAPGRAGLIVVGLLAVERFGIEFLRAKDDRLLGPLTVAQAISVAIVLVVVGFLVLRRPAAAAPEPAPSRR
ncbi:MAG TPA: prolipoprotein diacylglyceryl transferase family protein [Thermoanaerobaculia bacterium]|nr:prolipoprotein diacylglyceryl transferase family protein [Thermoanaerobaculia bacterium]